MTEPGAWPAKCFYGRTEGDIQRVGAIIKATGVCKVDVAAYKFPRVDKDNVEEVVDYLHQCKNRNFIPWVAIYKLD